MARILLVDDDPALLTALPEALARRLPNHDIITADSGEAALSLLKDDGFDLVISDLLMSGLGGTKLVEALEYLDRSVPSIIMTGTLERPDEQLPPAAVGIIRKPFDVSKLAEMVRRVLSK
jgi:DNA-binding NtrC family response regulator